MGIQAPLAQFPDMEEILSMINLTIEMINNKTDGFFDSETEHVLLKHKFDDSGCTYNAGFDAVNKQQTWAENHGHSLDGVIGDFCTDSSYYFILL